MLAAAQSRAEALAAGDTAGLEALLHPAFGWITHRGEVFDRERYLAANTGAGRLPWRTQLLEQPQVQVVRETAVLRCIVTDVIAGADGRETRGRMLMTQTWVRDDAARWVCLAGHAGPRLE